MPTYDELMNELITVHYDRYNSDFLEVQKKLLDGVKITPQRFGETTVTGCVIELSNGFSVLGQSSCVNPKEYNSEIGTKWALLDAIKKLDPIIAYISKESQSSN